MGRGIATSAFADVTLSSNRKERKRLTGQTAQQCRHVARRSHSRGLVYCPNCNAEQFWGGLFDGRP
jgi:hypothetical protein